MKNKDRQTQRLLTVKQAADRTGYEPTSIRQWVNERRLEHVRLGREIRIEESVFDAFIAAHTVPAVAQRTRAQRSSARSA